MIKRWEYKQILLFNSKVKRVEFIDNNNEVDAYLAIQRIDKLREAHLLYKKECDTYSIYMNLVLDKMNLYRQEIIDMCNEWGIDVEFINSKQLAYRKGVHAVYKYKGQDFSELIIFNKP